MGYATEEEERQVQDIFAEAAREISQLPIGLREVGLRLLQRSDPAQNGGASNKISYLLPFWVGESCDSPLSLCRDLAVGNLYAMLHFFLLDDAMDGGEGRVRTSARESLALGQLLQERFVERYIRHYPHESPLWSYYRKYLEQWASVVYREDETPADPRNVDRLARKAAPVKLCAAGLLLSCGQEADIPPMEEAVDLALAVLQLSDDWTDWLEDLQEPNTNAFLTLVRETYTPDTDILFNESMVKKSIYHLDCLERLAVIAEAYEAKLRSIAIAPPRLAAFQSAIVQGIRRDRDLADAWTIKLATEGGFGRLIEQMIEKSENE